MQRVPLDSVNFLTLREIAEMWAPDAGIPVSTMIRELRLATVNIPKRRKGLDPIPSDTPDNDLPDPDERVDRDWLVEFCSKQGWEHPSFWFGKAVKKPNLVGRPSYMPEILEELRARAAKGELADTLAEQARQLVNWVEQRFPGTQTPKQAGTENGIRKEFKKLKATDA